MKPDPTTGSEYSLCPVRLLLLLKAHANERATVTTFLANNAGTGCWHLLRGAYKRTQQLPTLFALG